MKPDLPERLAAIRETVSGQDAPSTVAEDLAEAEEELRAWIEYRSRREAEDAALDIDIDRIMASLPPLKPGKASIALGKMRTMLGMEDGPIGKVVEAAADELRRLRAIVTELRQLACDQCSEGEPRDAEGYHVLDVGDGTIVREQCEAWTDVEAATAAGGDE